MDEEKDLLTLLMDFVGEGYCCNDCFVMKVRELLNADVNCDEELKRRLQLIVDNDELVSNSDKAATIACLINEFYQEDN